MVEMDPAILDDANPEDPVSDTGEETPGDNPEDVQEDPVEEGSGGAEAGFFDGFPSFSFPSFFRSFRVSRQSRQLYSPCVDRITLPCIVEDFIGVGMGDLPSCLPVHCGDSLCPGGMSACKIETSVTPFYIGVHFGDGARNKGSPEDNIGACLRYRQLPCS